MIEAKPRLYISKDIRFDYSNSENLKNDIQALMVKDIKQLFKDGLQQLQGDNKENKGTTINELSILAMAYFFNNIFPNEYQIKDAYYTLDSVKGFLDANNQTSYTAIYEIGGAFFPLRDAELIKQCWLIIQSSWFLNSQYFGHHQHIDYLNYYSQTGEKLPIEHYKSDKSYLEKKYNDAANSKITLNGFKVVEQWHYYILFLVVNELRLPTTHFKTTYKGFREYNSYTKTSRQLRGLTPFVVVECDIKSAFPSFLDYQFGCKLKDDVYNNLMASKGVTRSEAKVLFNQRLNSGKYISKAEIADFLVSCGYDGVIAKQITALTHDPNKIFLYHMTEYEEMAIKIFKENNSLERAGRLHDSVLFIDNGIKPTFYNIEASGIEFGYKQLSRPQVVSFFDYSDKSLLYARISSLPNNASNEFKPFVKKHINKLPKVKGETNGFRIYESKFDYISADFDIAIKYTYNEFISNCKQMVSTLNYLNKRPITKQELIRVLNHIRQYSNIVFSIRYLSRFLVKHLNNIEDIEFKQIDFALTENLNFKKKIDFLNAYNEARKLVNQKNNLKRLYKRLEQCILNNEYPYLCIDFNGHHSSNKLERSILARWNYLTTGFERKPRVKLSTLYNSTNKELTAKLSKKQSKQLKYNVLIAKNWIQILLPHFTHETILRLPNNKRVIHAEKKLMEKLVGKENMKRLDPPKKKDFKPITPTLSDFNTDMSNSIFNQLEVEEAYYKGEQFFKEFEVFHQSKQYA